MRLVSSWCNVLSPSDGLHDMTLAHQGKAEKSRQQCVIVNVSEDPSTKLRQVDWRAGQQDRFLLTERQNYALRP